MDELIVALGVSAKITVVPTVTSDFLDYDGAFKALYTNLSGLVNIITLSLAMVMTMN
jgi:hypothetical protein